MSSDLEESVSELKKGILQLKGCLETFKDKPGMVLSVLQELSKLELISYRLLKETGIGKAVNGFRKADGEVGDIAKKLVSKWKDLASTAIKSDSSNEKGCHISVKKTSLPVIDSTTINKKLSERYKTTSISDVKVKAEKPDVELDKQENKHKTVLSTKRAAQQEPATFTEPSTVSKVKQEKFDDTTAASSGEKVVVKSEKVDKSFEDALVGKPKSSKKHKKSKSKSHSGEIENVENSKTQLSNTEGAGDCSLLSNRDGGKDLVKLHESISFSKLSEEPTPIKKSKSHAVKTPTSQSNTSSSTNKKTLALSDYKLLNNARKENSDKALSDIATSNHRKELDASHQRKQDNAEVGNQVNRDTKHGPEKLSSNVSPSHAEVARLDVGIDESDTARCDSNISLSKLQSDLNHLIDVIHNKPNSSDPSAVQQDDCAKLKNSQNLTFDQQPDSYTSHLSATDKKLSSPKSSPTVQNKHSSSTGSSSLPKAYAFNANSSSHKHSSSRQNSPDRSRHRNSEGYKSKSTSDRHHKSSSKSSYRDKSIDSSSKYNSSREQYTDHKEIKDFNKHKSRDQKEEKNSSKSDNDHLKSSSTNHKTLKSIKSSRASELEDYDKHSSRTQSSKRDRKDKLRRQSYEYDDSRSSEDMGSPKMSSDRPKSKNSRHNDHRAVSPKNSSSKSRHRHDSSANLKEFSKSESSYVAEEKVHAQLLPDKQVANTKDSSLLSKEPKHSSSRSSHEHLSKSHKKRKYESKSDSHKSSHRDSDKQDHKKHKHSAEKSHKRKRKMSDGGIDGSNGETFDDIMMASRKDTPKKRKAPSLEQKIAKTVAETPLPQSYLDDLPELLTDYKPLPKVNEGFVSRHEKSESTSQLAFSDIKASSRAESVYSGKRRGYSSMQSLEDLCLHVLGNNIDDIGYVGGAPYSILEPVLKKATPKQLFTIEDYNADFTQESDSLWKEHCGRDFKSQKPDEFESWRELYLRKYEERERKFEMLQNKISAKEQQKASEARKSKVAYAMASAPKPPREVRRQQAKYGTGTGSIESTAKAAAIQKQEQSLRPFVSSRSNASSSSREGRSSAKVISVPPLMKKAKKFMSKLHR